MRVISHQLPRENKEIVIVPVGDGHDGDQFADEAYVDERIKYVMDTPNAYMILCGDIANVATKNSKSDVYANKYTIDEQFDRQVTRFKPVADAGKLIGITDGNHEGRIYLEAGLSYTRAFAKQIGMLDIYSPTGIVVKIKVGIYKQIMYKIYATHGKKSGRKEGSKVQALVDLDTIVVADIYIHAHSHLGAIVTGTRKTIDDETDTIIDNEVLYVNLAASMDYGGYGEQGEYKPLSKKSPVIYLCGTRKSMDADLGERHKWE